MPTSLTSPQPKVSAGAATMKTGVVSSMRSQAVTNAKKEPLGKSVETADNVRRIFMVSSIPLPLALLRGPLHYVKLSFDTIALDQRCE